MLEGIQHRTDGELEYFRRMVTYKVPINGSRHQFFGWSLAAPGAPPRGLLRQEARSTLFLFFKSSGYQ